MAKSTSKKSSSTKKSSKGTKKKTVVKKDPVETVPETVVEISKPEKEEKPVVETESKEEVVVQEETKVQEQVESKTKKEEPVKKEETVKREEPVKKAEPAKKKETVQKENTNLAKFNELIVARDAIFRKPGIGPNDIKFLNKNMTDLAILVHNAEDREVLLQYYIYLVKNTNRISDYASDLGNRGLPTLIIESISAMQAILQVRVTCERSNRSFEFNEEVMNKVMSVKLRQYLSSI